MSVTDVTRMWSRSGGNYQSQKFDQFDTTYTLQEGFQVLTTVDTEAAEVLAHADVPKAGDQHPSGVQAFVRNRSPERISPIMWMVVVDYEGYDFDLGSMDLSWSDAETSEPIDRDYNGYAIVTVNGEPVEGLTVQIADPIVTVKRKFLYVDQYAIGPYRHAVNSDWFLGWPPGTARLVGWESDAKFKYGGQLDLYDVTARIQFRYPFAGATAAQAWYKRWRHEGIYVKIDGVLQRAKDHLGQEVSKPVLLNEDGTQKTNPDTAIFRYTQVYGSLPYNALGLIG